MGTMSKSLGGLSFPITASVQGALKAFSSLTTGTKDVWKSFDGLRGGLKTVSLSIVGSIGSMGKMGLSGLGALARGIDGMASRAMSADMPIDQMTAGFNKSFSAMTVGMNLTDSESKKWQSSIIAAHWKTMESAEDMGKGFAAARQQGVDLERALGTKGMTSTMVRLAKITSVFGIDSADLATTFAMLKKQFNVDEVAAKSYGDRIFSIGKVFGIGREAIQSWPSIVRDLSKEFADLGRKASPADIKRFSESIVTLGGSISTALGKPAQESLELSKHLFEVLAGSKRGVQDMFRGMGGEIGKVGMQIVETGGSVDSMFELINKDPEKFMEGLQRLARNTKATSGEMGIQFQRLTGSINQTLGPDVTNLMRANWSGVNEKLKELPDALSKSTDSLGRAADANHKFVGTGSEVEMMVDRFNLRMTALVRGSAEYKGWFKNLSTGFKSVGDKAAELAADKGPIGGLTRRFLLMQKVGLSGLFTQTGGALGVIATKATGALGAMSKLGIRLSDLPSLMGVGGPLLLGFAMFDKGLRKDLIGGVQRAGMWLKKNGPKELTAFMRQGKEAWKDVKEGLAPLMDMIKDGLVTYAPMVGDGIATMLNGIDWKSVGGSAGTVTAKLTGMLVPIVGAAFSSAVKLGIGMMFGGSDWSQRLAHFGGTSAVIFGAAMWQSPELRKKAFGFFKDLAGASKKPFSGVTRDWKAQTFAMVAAGAWMAENMKDEWADMSDHLKKTGHGIGNDFSSVFVFMLTGAMKFVDQFTGGWASKMIGGFEHMQDKMRIYWKTFILIMKDMWYSFIDSIVPGVMKAVNSMTGGLAFSKDDFAAAAAGEKMHRSEISSQQSQYSKELSNIEQSELAAHISVDSKAARMGDADTPAVGKRPARGGNSVPTVKTASPIASPALVAATSANMGAELAAMRSLIGAMAMRPIQVDMSLDGRKFGQAMFKQSADGQSYKTGNMR